MTWKQISMKQGNIGMKDETRGTGMNCWRCDRNRMDLGTEKV